MDFQDLEKLIPPEALKELAVATMTGRLTMMLIVADEVIERLKSGLVDFIDAGAPAGPFLLLIPEEVIRKTYGGNSNGTT